MGRKHIFLIFRYLNLKNPVKLMFVLGEIDKIYIGYRSYILEIWVRNMNRGEIIRF